jgi:glucose/mannose-6-phosphate isomerase
MSEIERKIEQHDEAQFLDLLDQFPDQVQNSWEIGRRVSEIDVQPKAVLVCGMGGSGISGRLLSQFTRDSASVPIQSNRSYELPEWVDDETLVILVSYSGNTEETLSCYERANDRGATCVAVTSNGELENQARQDDHTVVNVPPGLPPRCSTGYLFVPLLFVLDRVGVAERPDRSDFEEACEVCLGITDDFAPATEENRALTVAERLEGTIPLVYGSESTTGVLAERLKNQFNENAKNFAVFNRLPELHHNEIMSWDHLGEAPDRYTVLFLRDRGETERIQRRFEITREILSEHVARVEEVQSRGESRFARFLSLMLYTDYISYYLAILRGKDPSSIGPIEQLKQQL